MDADCWPVSLFCYIILALARGITAFSLAPPCCSLHYPYLLLLALLLHTRCQHVTGHGFATSCMSSAAPGCAVLSDGLGAYHSLFLAGTFYTTFSGTVGCGGVTNRRLGTHGRPLGGLTRFKRQPLPYPTSGKDTPHCHTHPLPTAHPTPSYPLLQAPFYPQTEGFCGRLCRSTRWVTVSIQPPHHKPVIPSVPYREHVAQTHCLLGTPLPQHTHNADVLSGICGPLLQAAAPPISYHVPSSAGQRVADVGQYRLRARGMTIFVPTSRHTSSRYFGRRAD